MSTLKPRTSAKQKQAPKNLKKKPGAAVPGLAPRLNSGRFKPGTTGKSSPPRPNASLHMNTGDSKKFSTRIGESRLGSDKPLAASRPTTAGLSLTKKLSLAITLVTAAITLLSGIVIANFTEHFLRQEVMKAGIGAVKLMAGTGRILLKQHCDGSDSTAHDLQKKIAAAVDGSRMEELLSSKLGDLETTFLDAHMTLKESSRAQEVNMFSVLGAGGEKLTIEGAQTIYDVEGLLVQEATLRQAGRSDMVFVFTKNLNLKDMNFQDEGEGRYRPDEGRVRVFLGTRKIADSVKEVYQWTAVIVAFSALLSLLVAIGLSLSITRPINMLVEDMRIVAEGDLSHKTISRSSDEVGYLATTFNELTHSLKVAHDAEIEQAKIKHELSVGREIQQILLPRAKPQIPGYDLDAFYLAANELGGDYYDFIVVDKSHLGVVVADVAGKGISASMYMTIMRTILNIAAVNNLSTQSCMVKTNRFLSDRIKRGMFVTAFYVILDCRHHILKCSSAGHNPMLIYRANSGSVEILNPSGIALGFDKGPLFQRTLKESDINLGPGDRFVLYTDGVVECMNEERQEYSDQKFRQFVAENATLNSTTFVENLVKELRKHQGKAPQHDDITIVTFKKL